MPVIRFRSREHDLEIPCPEGANLRMVLLRARVPLYTTVARAIHCRGLGTCGTCAVQVDGPVSAPTAIEERRLRVPPFPKNRPTEGPPLRLACQCNVEGDLTVTKGEGLWGVSGRDASR